MKLMNQGLAQNPSGDIPTHQAVANLTNATNSTQDIKQMDVIGGTVSATLIRLLAAEWVETISLALVQ
jgi:hypothetical protein